LTQKTEKDITPFVRALAREIIGEKETLVETHYNNMQYAKICVRTSGIAENLEVKSLEKTLEKATHVSVWKFLLD
jgi:hypothetical protein